MGDECSLGVNLKTSKQGSEMIPKETLEGENLDFVWKGRGQRATEGAEAACGSSLHAGERAEQPGRHAAVDAHAPQWHVRMDEGGGAMHMPSR